MCELLLWSVRTYHPFNVDPSLLYLFCFLPLTALALTVRWFVSAHEELAPSAGLQVLPPVQQSDRRALAGDDRGRRAGGDDQRR